MSHLHKVSKLRCSNSAPQFAMSKKILPHFYKALTSETYIGGEKCYHSRGFKPNICLPLSNLPNFRRSKLWQVKQQTKQPKPCWRMAFFAFYPRRGLEPSRSSGGWNLAKSGWGKGEPKLMDLALRVHGYSLAVQACHRSLSCCIRHLVECTEICARCCFLGACRDLYRS
jgi:hypothetical protein